MDLLGAAATTTAAKRYWGIIWHVITHKST